MSAGVGRPLGLKRTFSTVIGNEPKRTKASAPFFTVTLLHPNGDPFYNQKVAVIRGILFLEEKIGEGITNHEGKFTFSFEDPKLLPAPGAHLILRIFEETLSAKDDLFGDPSK